MSPRGTSRQVKPRPKTTKAKKLHKRPTRTQKLGGSKSERLHQARTGPLPHLVQPCACPCPVPLLPGPPTSVPLTPPVQGEVQPASTVVTLPGQPQQTQIAPPGPTILPGH